jgi:hypothetical protein
LKVAFIDVVTCRTRLREDGGVSVNRTDVVKIAVTPVVGAAVDDSRGSVALVVQLSV